MTDSNEFEEIEKLINNVFEGSSQTVTKLEAIRMVLSIETIQMLDELVEQLESESYSKDYIGGLKHARFEIKNRYTKNRPI